MATTSYTLTYNRYYPKPGPVAHSFEYEIGDSSPDIRTVEWIINLVVVDGKQYLQAETIIRHNGKVETELHPTYHEMIPVRRSTSIISQAHRILADVTARALSVEQYRNKR